MVGRSSDRKRSEGRCPRMREPRPQPRLFLGDSCPPRGCGIGDAARPVQVPYHALRRGPSIRAHSGHRARILRRWVVGLEEARGTTGRTRLPDRLLAARSRSLGISRQTPWWGRDWDPLRRSRSGGCLYVCLIRHILKAPLGAAAVLAPFSLVSRLRALDRVMAGLMARALRSLILRGNNPSSRPDRLREGMSAVLQLARLSRDKSRCAS